MASIAAPAPTGPSTRRADHHTATTEPGDDRTDAHRRPPVRVDLGERRQEVELQGAEVADGRVERDRRRRPGAEPRMVGGEHVARSNGEVAGVEDRHPTDDDRAHHGGDDRRQRQHEHGDREPGAPAVSVVERGGVIFAGRGGDEHDHRLADLDEAGEVGMVGVRDPRVDGDPEQVGVDQRDEVVESLALQPLDEAGPDVGVLLALLGRPRVVLGDRRRRPGRRARLDVAAGREVDLGVGLTRGAGCDGR